MATFYSQWLGNLRSYIAITEKSKDVANNKTLIAWSVYADKTGTNNKPYNLTNTTPVQVSINGAQVFNANVNYDLRTVSTQLIASGETYVSHDADGSKTVSISLTVDYSSTGTAYGYGKTTASGSMALATIARASTFTLSSYSFDFGTDVAVNITSSDASFTHSITYMQPNGTATAITGTTIKIPVDLISQISKATSYITTIKVDTKNASGTVIGSQSLTATVKVPTSYKPSITGLTPGGQNTKIGNNVAPAYNYLGGIDKITTSITITNSASATTEYVEYQLVNSSGTVVASAKGTGTTSVTFNAPIVANGSELFTLKAMVVDSRARSSAWTASTIKVRSHAYSNPTVWNLIVGRLKTNQENVDGVVSWKVSPIYNGGGTTGQVNTASMVVKYKLKGAATWTELSANTKLETTNYDIPFDGIGFPAYSNYEFMAEVTDAFGKTNSTSIINVSGVFVHMDFGPKGVGIGKDHSDSNYDLEVGAGGVNSDGPYKLNGKSIQNVQVTQDNGQAISVTGDANNLTTTGFYMGSNLVNQPTGNGHVWKYYIVMRHNDYHIVQICIDFSNTFMQIRSATGVSAPVWGQWKYIANQDDVKILMAGSVANYDVNSWLRVIRNQLEISDRIDANMIASNAVIWCKVPSAFNVPTVNGLLMSFTIDSTQRSQIYYGADNKLYQRQYQNSVWGAWSSGR